MAIPLVPNMANHARYAGVPVTGISDYVTARVFGAATAETETMPASTAYKYVAVSATADMYLRRGGTAAQPAADVTDGTGSFLLRAGAVRIFGVTPGLELSVIAPGGSGIVTFEYFGE